MLEAQQRRLLLRSLKGAPLSVLMALFMFPTHHSEVDLSSDTGYSRKTVRSALFDLESLGFVKRDGRYEAWILEAAGRQMVLGEELDGANEELADEGSVVAGAQLELTADDERSAIKATGKFYPSRPCSSSCIQHDLAAAVSKPETTTTCSARGKNYPSPSELPEWDVLVGLGCSPDRVSEALVAGLEHWGDELGGVVEGWVRYVQSDQGSSLVAPGFFVARRLSQGIEAPEVEVDETRAAIEAAFERLVRR